jgi:alkylation response protein AidB-like acyl-CoA dehydrogenase
MEEKGMATPSAEDLDRYRKSFRGWLETHIPDWWREGKAATSFEVPEDRFEDVRAWHRELFDAGYMGVQWPREYGGQGLTIHHEILRGEELEREEAPPTVNLLGITLCGPALLGYGSEEQKQRYLKKMLSAEEIWCQGYSEPDSGSDLASLQTRAERKGDEYIVNGQKIWTSNGLQADWMFCLVRTDPNVKKQAGIGFLLIDMHGPGIEVSPLKQITGGQDFCQVFFTDVPVPAENMVGEPTQGWKIANHVLMHERGATVDFMRYGRFLETLADAALKLQKNGRPLTEDPLFRDGYTKLCIEYEALRQTTLRSLRKLQSGEAPGPESSIYKVQASEFEQRLTRFAANLQGPYGQLWQSGPRAVDDGIWQFRELWARSYSIYAGTNEIQRNILAERVLGLPRG